MATLFRNIGARPNWIAMAISENNKDIQAIAKYEMTNSDLTSPFYGGNKPFYNLKSGNNNLENFKQSSSKGLSINI